MTDQMNRFLEKIEITPGPWESRYSIFNGGAKVYQKSSGNLLCKDYDENRDIKIRMNCADADLIAASPELLYTLIKSLFELFDLYQYYPNNFRNTQEQYFNEQIEVIEKACNKPWTEVSTYWEESFYE